MVKNINKIDIKNLYDQLLKKKNEKHQKSYTSFLIDNPAILAKKIGEESVEVIIEILKNDKVKLVNESADLIYHLVAAWIYCGINPNDVWAELGARKRNSNKEVNK